MYHYGDSWDPEKSDEQWKNWISQVEDRSAIKKNFIFTFSSFCDVVLDLKNHHKGTLHVKFSQKNTIWLVKSSKLVVNFEKKKFENLMSW